MTACGILTRILSAALTLGLTASGQTGLHSDSAQSSTQRGKDGVSQNSHSTSTSETVPNFRAETRLVVVDVVVADRRGQPSTDLKKSQITLVEDGKPQRLQIFELHVPPAQLKAAPGVTLPPNQYTNLPIQRGDSSINVVLFDLLNTPLSDQAFAQWQMMEFLKNLPAGKQVALFSLGSKLRMIAGFTTSSQELTAAAAKFQRRPSLLTDEEVAQAQAPPRAPEGSVGSALYEPSSSAIIPELMQQFLFEENAFRTSERVQWTLEALNQLARALSGYSGRKNVIWLSEGFPIALAPNVLSVGAQNNVRNYSSSLRESSELLSSAQISVYPVDVRGVKAGLGIREIADLQAFYDTMNDIARQTGGKAFYSTNDVKGAIGEALEHGGTYYTVAYIPTNQNWDSNYRHITIKLARPDLKPEYRPGYYATAELPSSTDEKHNRLAAAIQPTVPQSTMLLLRAQVLPPDAQFKTVRIDCGVYAPDISFTENAERTKNAQLEFGAVAWDKNNVAAGNASEMVNLALKHEEYASSLQHGVSAHLELELKPGTYNLRLGVIDNGSNRIGTLDVPLQIEDRRQTPRK